MKTMLFTLLRVIDFELAVPVDDIEGKSTYIHPYIEAGHRIDMNQIVGW